MKLYAGYFILQDTDAIRLISAYCRAETRKEAEEGLYLRAQAAHPDIDFSEVSLKLIEVDMENIGAVWK